MTGIKEVAKVDGKRYLGKDGTRKLKVSGRLFGGDRVWATWTSL